MEWYESAGRSDYNFDTPAPSSSAAAYGTFEDEPPLLEGENFASNTYSDFLWTQHRIPFNAPGIGDLPKRLCLNAVLHLDSNSN